MSDSDEGYRSEREKMVARQLVARGIRDEGVLAAMRSVPRHRFVDAKDRELAYADHPLPIGSGQTISQPYMVARMVELCQLGGGERVLEVGAGSGYQTAVLAALSDWVYGIEIVPSLAQRARAALADMGVRNATVIEGDGSLGYADEAPYDAIVVAAGAPAVPPPLISQLREGGRLIIPVGPMREVQVLQVHRRVGKTTEVREDTGCRFVDLRGRHGWSS